MNSQPVGAAEGSRAEARRHLVRLLLEQLQRSFALDGADGGIRMMNDLLAGLDDEALRAYAYRQGIRAEDEFEGEVE